MTEQCLRMWTLYENPLDHPEHWVLRCFTITAKGPKPDGNGYLFERRRDAEIWLETTHHGLCFIQRHQNDQPQIVGIFI